ncbi:MAG TPA: PQQ-binding-like beta-propeller repeat protein [Tepidisphaeraceae bacterium]|jgi:outer membrane protein assembly factor BamB|nr:PQQ-binding-like beta-propeller repeat protein [Tepidisphaeraceae bacterium]
MESDPNPLPYHEPRTAPTRKRGIFSPRPEVTGLRRWRLPIAFVLLAIGVLCWILLSDSIEGNFKFLWVALDVALTGLVLAGWMLLLSGLPWLGRFATLGGAVLSLVILVFALKLTTRTAGTYTGAGVPKLVWKWTPKHTLAPLGTAVTATAAIDLSSTTPDDSPQFLGTDRDNQIRNVHLSRDWSATPPVELWRRPVGPGWGAFAVVGKYALTQEQRGEEEAVVCYEAATGNPVWEHLNHAHYSEFQAGEGPHATPTIVGGRVYVQGATGILDCLDGANGKVIWSRDIVRDSQAKKNLYYGQSGSPLIHDKLVIVPGPAGETSLLAYDRNTGELAWKAGHENASYASPVFAIVAGVPQVLNVNQHAIAGFNPTDGKMLWESHWPGELPKASQPVPVGSDRVYCSSGYGLGSVFLQIVPSNDTLAARELWHSSMMKTEFTNVVIRDGQAYGLDDSRLTCQDLATGKKNWRGENYGHGQILLADGLLIIQSEPGDVALVDAKPTGATELGRLPALHHMTWNPPTLAGHLLLVRNSREAVCYRLP